VEVFGRVHGECVLHRRKAQRYLSLRHCVTVSLCHCTVQYKIGCNKTRAAQETGIAIQLGLPLRTLQDSSQPKGHEMVYCTALYCTLLYCTELYCTVLYCTVLYCAVQYSTVQYSTASIIGGVAMYPDPGYFPQTVQCQSPHDRVIVVLLTIQYCIVVHCTVLCVPYLLQVLVPSNNDVRCNVPRPRLLAPE